MQAYRVADLLQIESHPFCGSRQGEVVFVPQFQESPVKDAGPVVSKTRAETTKVFSSFVIPRSRIND